MRELLDGIIDGTRDLIAALDLELRLTALNQAYREESRRLFGCDLAVGVNLLEALSHRPEDQEKARRLWGRALSGERFSEDLQFEEPGGGRSFYEARYSPIRDAAGRLLGACHVIRDVTAQRQAEALQRQHASAQRALQQAKDAAEEASRAKDQFLAVLSHELRTPLTPVLAAAQLMEIDPDLPARYRDRVKMIRRSVQLEARLIDDLLDLTRIARGKLELQLASVDLHEKVLQVVRMLEAEAAARQIGIALSLEAARPLVMGDTARLQQVLWNLLKNAVKFTPPGGRVEVRTSEAPEGRLRVQVRDTGVGIDPEVLPRIFDAFEQGGSSVTRQFGGLGLGLAISKSLVDLHGGTLSAASEGPGRGATFTLELPALAPEAKAATGSAATAPPPEGGRGARLLLVEDHLDTADAMARLLGSFGYDVRVAGTVASALQAAEAESFDAVVSDLGLPDGNGHDLMRQLVSRFGLKGIAVSGYGMEEDVRRSHEVGFAAHLTKPVDLRRLRTELRELVGG